MATRLTNKLLRQLLISLGFQMEDATQKLRRVFRHPESGCVLLLPDNKTLEPPFPADLVSVRAHLAYRGHLHEDEFDEFVREGKLPVAK